LGVLFRESKGRRRADLRPRRGPRTRMTLKPSIDEADRMWLRELGFSRNAISDLSEAAKDEDRERVLEWCEGLKSNRGTDWAKAIRDCGRIFPALLPDGKVVLLPRPCKVRACPRCMKARAVKIGNELRSVCRDRHTETLQNPDGSEATRKRRFAFVTLTQRKRVVQNENCAQAVSRILKSWGKLTGSASRKRNEDLRAMIAGGVRGLECVWSGRGRKVFERRRAGQTREQYFRERQVAHTVRASGWHAHLHCIFELRDWPSSDYWFDEFAEEIRDVWAWASPKSNPQTGVDVQRLDLDSVFQVAKYVSKPLSLSGHRARELFQAVHSRRLLNGFGDWVSWRKWAPEEPNPYEGAKLCAVSMQTLAKTWATYEARGRGARSAESVAFCEWHHCEDRSQTIRRVVGTMEMSDLMEKLSAAASTANKQAEARRFVEDEG